MKVLQVPFHYYPDAVGGTEVYVSALAQRLLEHGTDVEIAAPADAGAAYFHNGIRVHRFGVTTTPSDLAMLYGEGDAVATRQFTQILQRTQPDLVHLHAMSPAVSLQVLREIKRQGVPVVFTCHIPGITCPRGTLLRYGERVCDGVWGSQKCTSCALQSRGLPIPLAVLIAALPISTGRQLAARGLRGSGITALRMRDLQTTRRRALVGFLSEVDRIVAVSDWLRQMLISNGVNPDKVVLCRHGSSQRASRQQAAPPTQRRDFFKLAFLGRLSAIKGVHVLVEALRKSPDLAIKLDIFGIVQDDLEYVDSLRKRIGNDRRIQLLVPLLNEEVVDRLRGYDALAVPSQWMETGPLVVYDAFLAGIPVIGSNRGGIAELVTHERNGLLVEPNDPRAWAAALERLTSDKQLLQQLRAGIRAPRSMTDVAAEMLNLYLEVALPFKPVHDGQYR
jgi:glycosyltransferase involved in cell wall biosynthesis